MINAAGTDAHPKTIVHLTSVHPVFDNRIFHKECKSAAAAGYDVVLVAPHPRSETIEDIRIRAVRPPRNRFIRATVTAIAVAKAALAEKGDIYHLHDPELLPVGAVLRLYGKRVVYDIHEDITTSIAQKNYLPPFFRTLLGRLIGYIEQAMARSFELILAEKYYLARFPRGTPVLNYPRLKEEEESTAQAGVPASRPLRLLYTGVLSIDRGALNHVNILRLMPDVEITMVGRCPSELAEQLYAEAGIHVDRLRIVGAGRYVPYQEITQQYRRGGWLAGLAVFPRTPHYERKELTKFFEYMRAGIPVLCSNFPIWRALIEGHGVGICVDPDDPGSIRAAIQSLADDPAAMRSMAIKGKKLSKKLCWEEEAAKLLQRYDILMKNSTR